MTNNLETSDVPEEEELSEEEKELRKIAATLYSIRLDSLAPVKDITPVGYRVMSQRGSDKSGIYLSRSAVFISLDAFEISGEVITVHNLAKFSYVYLKSDQDGKEIMVEVPSLQGYRIRNGSHYSGRANRLWVEGDAQPGGFIQVR